MLKTKPKFIPWEELNKDGMHQYRNDLPPGQQWGASRGIGGGGGWHVTNGRGEGFILHGATKYKVLPALVDALNKRDFQIAELEEK